MSKIVPEIAAQSLLRAINQFVGYPSVSRWAQAVRTGDHRREKACLFQDTEAAAGVNPTR